MFMFRALQKNRNVIFLVVSPEVCGLLAEAFLAAKKVKPSPCLPLEMPTTSARRLKRRSTTTGKQLRSSRRRVAHCQALFDRCRTCLADFSFDRIVEYKRTYRTFVTVSSWCRTWVTSFSERMRIELYTRIDFVLHRLIYLVFRHRQLSLLQVWHWLGLQKDCRGLSEGEPVWFSLVRQLGTFIAKWRMACFSNFSFDYRIVFEILWKREVFCWETMCVRHRPASSSAMWRRLQQMQNVWRSCKETKEHLFYFASGKAKALEASRCYLSLSQMLVDSSRWCNRGCCPFFAVAFAGCVAKAVSSECLRLWQSFKRSKILRNLTCASCLLLWSSLSEEYTAWIDSKKVSVI